MSKPKKLRISLDLDDTLFDWRGEHEKKFHCKLQSLSQEEITSQVEQCKYNKQFWENMPKLVNQLDFEPSAYITKRINLVSYTRNSILKAGFPNKRIYHVKDPNGTKASYVKRYSDVLIDDEYQNVMDCIKVGVPALLITRPHNRFIQTPYRVNSLTYNEIYSKYIELFTDGK